MKVFLGFVSIISFLIMPLLLVYMFFGFIPEMVALEQQGIEPEPQQIIGSIGVFVLMILIFSVLSLGLYVFFIVHAIKDKTATDDTKLLWVLLLVFLSNFIYPFYWYFRIWANSDAELIEGQEAFEVRSN